MSYSTYKIIKSLKPLELYEIITRNSCEEYLPKIKKEIIETQGEWFLNNWGSNKILNITQIKLDTLDLYLSDKGFELFTSKKEAERLKQLFTSWNIFYNVYSKWYGGNDNYTVGFSYDDKAFNTLYKEWIRDKKLNKILE